MAREVFSGSFHSRSLPFASSGSFTVGQDDKGLSEVKQSHSHDQQSETHAPLDALGPLMFVLDPWLEVSEKLPFGMLEKILFPKLLCLPLRPSLRFRRP